LKQSPELIVELQYLVLIAFITLGYLLLLGSTSCITTITPRGHKRLDLNEQAKQRKATKAAYYERCAHWYPTLSS
jgi:hypothetical protein